MSEILGSSHGELSVLLICILVLAAIVAGYIDTLVGGGGLITIPALLAAGVPPIAALGTNKLQACAGTATASITLLMKKQLKLSDVSWAMLTAFIGALIGATVVQRFDAELLALLIPAVISLIVLYFIFSSKFNSETSEPTISASTYRATAVPAIGFYDGMFGPATGSFFVLAGVSLRGQGVVKASMIAKTLNFATNVASLMIFIWYGQVAFFIGFIMMVGQFIGASLGARALMKIDPSALRGLVVVVCVVMLGVWFIRS